MEAEERPTKKRRLSSEDTPQIKNTSQVELPKNEESSLNGAMDESIEITSCQDEDINEPNGAPIADKVSGIEVPPPEVTAPVADSTNGNSNDPPMSKNQQKKLRKKLEWESKREDRKFARKQKTIAKRNRKREERTQLTETGDLPAPTKSPKSQRAVQLPVTFLIDCDFDDLMRDHERTSLAMQITRSYSDNQKALFRTHLAICSFAGKLRERFDNVLSHYKGWKGVRFLDCDFVEAAEKAKEWMLDPKKGGKLGGVFSSLNTEDEHSPERLAQQGEVVYLTSEADEVLTELKPYSTYIIGGLVDKNREKGICYRRATRRGIKTARLPIGEFMAMQSRKVLATNHVNEIMLKWLECGDWGEAFVKAIPKRKGGKLKGAETDADAAANAEVDGQDEADEEPLPDGGAGRDIADTNGDVVDSPRDADELPSANTPG